jgi:hypothetical protein
MAAPQALLIDIFGTCVDWYSRVSQTLAAALDQAPDNPHIAEHGKLQWDRLFCSDLVCSSFTKLVDRLQETA